MKIQEKMAEWIATAIGLGKSPWAPGTVGTLGGVVLHLLSAEWSWSERLFLWSLVFLGGAWAIGILHHRRRSGDAGWIVVDEVLGFGIAAWTAGLEWKSVVVAFVLFRIFDILKPPPIRFLDRWSKKRTESWLVGVGVILDDVLAGLFALAGVVGLQWGGWLL